MGFNNYNLFPTVGADGPCSVHVNFGQSGFVFIEANVKKWGLAPSSGTLAPPPPYGSERGSILLAAGGDITPITVGSPAGASSRSRRSHRSRRTPRTGLASSAPHAPSPLSTTPARSPTPPDTPPPPITPIEEEPHEITSMSAPGPSTGPGRRYISPTDLPFHTAPNAHMPPSPTVHTSEEQDDDESIASSRETSRSRSTSPTQRTSTRTAQTTAAGANQFNVPRRQPFNITHTRTGSRSSYSGSELAIHVHPPPESPVAADPPTPDVRDISLEALQSGAGSRTASGAASPLPEREPPAYSPLDAYAYVDGVQLDLPAEIIAAALETGTLPSNMLGASLSNRSGHDRRRSRRDRRT